MWLPFFLCIQCWCVDSSTLSLALTVKTQYQNFETNIPRKGIAWPQSIIYYRSAYSAAGKYVDRSGEYINRMNVEIMTKAAQFFFWEDINGIFVAVQCSTFLVHSTVQHGSDWRRTEASNTKEIIVTDVCFCKLYNLRTFVICKVYVLSNKL